jgi:pyruvate formate lyase activating enzyme
MNPRVNQVLLALVFFLSLPFLAYPAQAPPLKEASFYQKLKNQAVHCELCPHSCVIPEGKRGFCGVRVNKQGTLITLSFGRLVSMNDLDPVEKKPLFHFLPGQRTFSIATAGCNLTCVFCQNWEISQSKPDQIGFTYLTPEELVDKVKASGLKIIAYTYSEPTIFYEYMIEVARIAKANGIRNVMHSNGYINKEPLEQLCAYLDAANIDVKAFTDDYYFKMSGGHLGPVLDSLKLLKAKGVHVEITALIISGYNDSEDSIKKMCVWIKQNLGPDTPLHFSRAFPMYKLLSIAATPVSTLEKALSIARSCGLNYVYIGNVAGSPAENTYCPRCLRAVIVREGLSVNEYHIKDGKCAYCHEVINGIWE